MKYSLQFRVWHWVNAFVILGLLGTVFLRKTFLSWRTNSEILLQKLSEMSIDITAEQAKILAKAVRAGMWEWHIILGYLLAALILYRLFLFLRDSSERVAFSELSNHKKGVRLLYFIFYAVVLFMSISGLVIHFYEALNITKEKAHDIKEVHEALYNFFLVFVPMHIAGVVIAESKDERGLISSMVHGKA